MKTKISTVLCGLISGLLLLAAQPVSAQDTLYGVSSDTDNLHTIDPTTGLLTVVGPLGSPFVDGLAFHPDGTLFGVDFLTEQLLTIDTTTGAATTLGATGFFRGVRCLAFDSSGTLFGVDTRTDQLVTINTTTGAATAVGAIGFRNVIGLAFDSNDSLYGVDSSGAGSGSNQLLTVNTLTGSGTAVGGALGFFAAQGLAFDSSDTLFSFTFGTRQLVTINTTTGAATAVGPNVGVLIRALSFERVLDTDGDGVPDDADICPDSILTETVIIDGIDTGVENIVFADGCSIADLLVNCAMSAKNHGAFVSCVAKLTNSLKKSGDISAKDKGSIQSAAGQSDIGK